LPSDKWTIANIPDQTGKTALVTGGNSGLGYECVKVFASKGANLVLSCRDLEKGDAARDRIIKEFPEARVAVMWLDLADLSTIRQFASAFHSNYNSLHLLFNNGGVMATPHRTTIDGFELQFGTNHLGHFALTGLLLDVLLSTSGSRVITVSSIAERFGWINFKNLMGERFYERWIAYCQSKLANVLFAYELQRRLNTIGAKTISLAAHPGFTVTGLRTELMGKKTPLLLRLLATFFERMSQDVEMGVLPLLYAATDPKVSGGEYYGTGGFFQIKGYPKQVRSSKKSYNRELARRLWEVSENLTNVKYQAFNA
jgi:NAD(P)-dependent dehydrogenase (short-subunit alcohol dehydrogenase family)